MGKGNTKSFIGKLFRKSYGKYRPRKQKKNVNNYRVRDNTMKPLYKYKRVGNIQDTTHKDYKYFVDILENSRIYAATYKELQEDDEKEGIYHVDKNHHYSRKLLDDIKEEKIHIRVCSMSKDKNNEYLWKKYTDNHKGVVIEVEINATTYNTRPVEYGQLYKLKRDVITDENIFQEAMNILTHKTEKWKEEKEERVFVPNSKTDPKSSFVKVKVNRIITGRNMDDTVFKRINELISTYNQEIKVIKEAKQS